MRGLLSDAVVFTSFWQVHTELVRKRGETEVMLKLAIAID